MVARHFIDENQLSGLLQKNLSPEEALALCKQQEEHDYTPPRPERIVEWQQ